MNYDKKDYGAKRHVVLLRVCVSLLLLLFTGHFADIAAASPKKEICFYSSETNINNYVALKSVFETYLEKHGAYDFLPFNNRLVFEEYIKDKSDIIVLVSSWHFQQIRKEYSLEPIWVGERDGNTVQRRFVVIHKQNFENPLERIGPVATSSDITHTEAVLAKIFGKLQQAPRILSVPKDIDALMSVGYRMAISAMVTEHSFNSLASVDRVLYQNLKIKGAGAESLLLIVAVSIGASESTRKFVDIIHQMPKDSDGLKALKMIDLDNWKQFDSSENKKLED